MAIERHAITAQDAQKISPRSAMKDRCIVLSVEDDPDHQMLIEDALRQDARNWQSHHVTTLDAMVETLKFLRPQAILLDLGLRESRGLATLEKALTLVSDFPILVLTAHRDQAIGIAAVRLGAADFIDKLSLDTSNVGMRITFAHERFAARRKIERSNQFLRTFVASIGHDLRAPPRQINRCVQIIAQELAQPAPKVSEALTAIRDRTEHLRAILDATLDYAQKATVCPNLTSLRLSQVVEQVKNDLDPSDALRVRLTGDTEFTADAHLAYLALANLIGNGLKYWRELPSQVTVFGCSTEARTEIFVCDTGIGMSPDLLARASLPSMRGVSDSEFSGTGFGLAIVKLLVEAHDGGMSISSAEGEGTRVRLLFPLSA